MQENNAQTTLCQKPFSFFFAVAKLFAHAKFKLQPVINYALLIHYCFRFFNLYVGHYNNKIPVWWRRQIKDKKNIDGHDLIVPVCRCACICLVNSGFKLHLEFTSRSRFLPIHDEEKREGSIKHHIDINKTKQRKEIIIKSQKEDNQVQ